MNRVKMSYNGPDIKNFLNEMSKLNFQKEFPNGISKQNFQTKLPYGISKWHFQTKSAYETLFGKTISASEQ